MPGGATLTGSTASAIVQQSADQRTQRSVLERFPFLFLHLNMMI
jgi:hypothetical protein